MEMTKKIIKKPIFDKEIFLIKSFLEKELAKHNLNNIGENLLANDTLKDSINKETLREIKSSEIKLKNEINEAQATLQSLKTQEFTLQQEIKKQQSLLEALKQKINLAEEELKTIQLQKEEIIVQAKKQGQSEGLQLGKIQGKQQILQKLNSCLQKIEETKIILENKVKEFIKREEEILKASEGEMLKAVIVIAEKIVQKISREDKMLCLHLIKEAAKKIKDTQEVMLRVSPADYEIINKEKNKIIELLKGVENLKIIADEEINSGGVILETAEGKIDANISSQLQEIKKSLQS